MLTKAFPRTSLCSIGPRQLGRARSHCYELFSSTRSGECVLRSGLDDGSELFILAPSVCRSFSVDGSSSVAVIFPVLPLDGLALATA